MGSVSKLIPAVVAAILLFLASAPCKADDEVWLVGGGPDVFSSQVQIESNVLWALRVIESLPGERRTRIWFTDGDDPAPDVVEWSAPPESEAALQPLARISNSYVSNGEHYRNHRIPDVEGPTDAPRLTEFLGNRLRQVKPEDSRWLIFNGHGQLMDDLNNTIELWNNTWLQRDDLNVLLRLAPKQARFRFLFTQCFSGAYTELAEVGTHRCGFVAEAADREAEGCSAAIEKSGYRDYSTYFFAALAGIERDGGALDRSPDRDGDGTVTPLEAHYYTLTAAHSSDIPRATSEALLEQWRPWYLPLLLRWMSEPDNDYSQMARELMSAAGIAVDSDAATRLAALRAELEAERSNLARVQAQLAEEMGNIREFIEEELIRRWPRGAFAYTLNYKRFLEQDLADAQRFVLEHPGYPELLEREQRYWKLNETLLTNERALTRLEKIEHLRNLARIRQALRAFWPGEVEDRYRALLACESEPF